MVDPQTAMLRVYLLGQHVQPAVCWVGTRGHSALSIFALFSFSWHGKASNFSTRFITIAHISWIRNNMQHKPDSNRQKIGVKDLP